MTLAEISNNPLIKPTEETNNRDDRFRTILRRQFGDHGLELIAYQGFIFLVVIVLFMTLMLTTLPMNAANQTLFTLGRPKNTANPMTTVSIR